MHRHLLWEKLARVVWVFFAHRVLIPAAVKATVPALFSFGDSILDTGNNNNLVTLTKCNFPPYGKDFIGGVATGRFCDGKIPSDLIADALGIKQTLPAYLDPNLQNEDLTTGVSFASGGSGNDDLTANMQGVLTLSAQLQNFQQYIERLKGIVGEENANSILSNSLVLFSSGNNDIALTYPRRIIFDFPTYANALVASASIFMKNLYGLGVRRLWVISTLPLGCLPGARTILGGPSRACSDIVNGLSQLFNERLSAEVGSIKTSLPDFQIEFTDVYTPLLNIIQNPLTSGFANVASGCCGTGTVEIAELCNAFIVTCPYPSSFVFWDSGHPTQRTYQIVVSDILQRSTLFQGITSSGAK